MWREGTACDLDLLVCGRSFSVHRVVLGATSQYFKALLCGEHFSESAASAITIPDVTAEAFEHVLEFIYTQTCSLPLDSLQPVLEAACRMQCAELQQAAEAALIDHLSPTTCLDAWDFADHYSLTPLTAAAKKIALESFEQVATSSGFSQLPPTRLDELLEDDALGVQKEETTLSTLEAWFQAQPSPPDQDVTERLLGRIRFPLMEQGSRRALESSPLVQRHPMVLVSAYREEMLKEQTPRNRKRKRMTPLQLTYDDLRVGMRVLVMEDEDYVSAECSKPAPNASKSVHFAEGMRGALGVEFEISKVQPGTQSALLSTRGLQGMFTHYAFPFTTLLRASS